MQWKYTQPKWVFWTNTSWSLKVQYLKLTQVNISQLDFASLVRIILEFLNIILQSRMQNIKNIIKSYDFIIIVDTKELRVVMQPECGWRSGMKRPSAKGIINNNSSINKIFSSKWEQIN